MIYFKWRKFEINAELNNLKMQKCTCVLPLISAFKGLCSAAEQRNLLIVEDAEENQTGLSNDHVQLVQKIEAEWKEKLEKSKVQFKSELEFLESSFNRQVQFFFRILETFNICV